MKIVFYNYQAFLKTVEALTMEGLSFSIETNVNHSVVFSKLDTYIILFNDIKEEK